MDKEETIELLTGLVYQDSCITQFNAMEIKAFDARGNKIFDDALIAPFNQPDKLRRYFDFFLTCKLFNGLPDTFASISISLTNQVKDLSKLIAR